jgi:hypothetical protein
VTGQREEMGCDGVEWEQRAQGVALSACGNEQQDDHVLAKRVSSRHLSVLHLIECLRAFAVRLRTSQAHGSTQGMPKSSRATLLASKQRHGTGSTRGPTCMS